MTNKELADLIYPNITKTVEDYEKQYPERDLPEGAIVARYAPSPTGYIHIGALYQSFVAQAFCRQTHGTFFLRIEDTDTKRTIDNGINKIIDGLKEYNVNFDEGPIDNDGHEKGAYGPYIQSERREIYQTYIKHLIEEGLAYPCFCSPEELEAMRAKQEKTKARIGYYGPWATCRNLSNDQRAERIKNGDPYIIRLKSPGRFDHKITVVDAIKGKLVMPENDMDLIICKSDGLPTYHFAHAIDDHLMHTTHVIRGDEWVASLAIHIQLFQVLGFKAPTYAHLAPISKIEDGKVRKISKRKDPEAATSYYHEMGVPLEAVKLYLGTLANSGFEPWYTSNPNVNAEDYVFDFSKMSRSPAIFDLDKLNFICKEYIAKLKAPEVYEQVKAYVEEYDSDFAKLFTRDPAYSTAFLNIEREQKKPRKDIAYYKDVKREMWYMFDELFEGNWEEKDTVNAEILKDYVENYYDANATQQEWFDKIAEFGKKYNYATTKEYKANPEAYAGSVGTLCEMLRYVVTGKHQSPSLYDILKLLGKDRILNRVNMFIANK